MAAGLATATAAFLDPDPVSAGWFDSDKDKPGYANAFGIEQNFDAHVLYGDLVGEDYTFVYGMPMVSSVEGKVIWAKNFGKAFGNEILIDYGVVLLGLGHNDKMFVEEGDIIDRMTCLATEGKSGFGARGISHVQASVIGNMAFIVDPYFNQLDDVRFRDDRFYVENHMVDIRRIRAGGPGPLFERPYNPNTDCKLDDDYWNYVNANVKSPFELLGRGLHITHPVAVQIRKGTLVDKINQSMREFERLSGEIYDKITPSFLNCLDDVVEHMAKLVGVTRDELTPYQAESITVNFKNLKRYSLSAVDVVVIMRLEEIYRNVRQAGSVPIRLSPTPTICSVHPFS